MFIAPVVADETTDAFSINAVTAVFVAITPAGPVSP
jgi:hypothetical protein